MKYITTVLLTLMLYFLTLSLGASMEWGRGFDVFVTLLFTVGAAFVLAIVKRSVKKDERGFKTDFLAMFIKVVIAVTGFLFAGLIIKSSESVFVGVGTVIVYAWIIYKVNSGTW